MDEHERESSVSFSSSSSSSDSSSLDEVDSSSSSNSSWNNIAGPNGGPLYDMKTLLHNLPCKRGLSNFFGGKSQSFSCLADVECVEELSKDLYCRRKKLKSSHSCGSRLSNNNEKNGFSHEPRISPSSMIAKRPQTASKMMMNKKAVSFVMRSRPPLSSLKRAS